MSDCVLTEFGECSYSETGCSDCLIKEKIRHSLGNCKDCDKWKQGKTGNDKDWYSDEGFCTNWRTMTGEKFYCADFEAKENDE